MIASRVHAIMAAGLENPALLARWQQEPDLLRSYGVDPADFDLDAIWKFAGLSAKVKHNGLRAELPLTFRFLNVNGLEIELFGAYASHKAQAGTRYATTTAGRIVELVDFLRDWLDADKREHSLLWDLIRHETALAQLRRLTPTPKRSRVPHIVGEIILHEMNSDPRVIGKRLRQKSFDLGKVRRHVTRLCYWNAGDPNEICIVELDELGFSLLSVVDGKRSLADFNRLLGGGARISKKLNGAFAELASVGVISLGIAPVGMISLGRGRYRPR
jgi:hypothetical protein